ncbi:hypothetical protein AALF16_25115 [Bacillus cereus]|uniref:hypothetical protein n=1 Tax=Bacillus cereus TaxID=1396 RepID=UPI00356EBBA6
MELIKLASITLAVGLFTTGCVSDKVQEAGNKASEKTQETEKATKETAETSKQAGEDLEQTSKDMQKHAEDAEKENSVEQKNEEKQEVVQTTVDNKTEKMKAEKEQELEQQTVTDKEDDGGAVDKHIKFAEDTGSFDKGESKEEYKEALEDIQRSHKLSQELVNSIVIGKKIMDYDSVLPLASSTELSADQKTVLYVYKQGNKTLRITTGAINDRIISVDFN